jgi:hypothetical protein
MVESGDVDGRHKAGHDGGGRSINSQRYKSLFCSIPFPSHRVPNLDPGRRERRFSPILILCVFVRIMAATVMHRRDVLAALRADGWAEVARSEATSTLSTP